MVEPLASGKSSCETARVPLVFDVRLRHAVSGPSPDGSGSTISDRFSIVATTVEWDSNGTVVFLLDNNPVAAFTAASVLQVSRSADVTVAVGEPSPKAARSTASEEPTTVEKATTQTNTGKKSVPSRHGETWSYEEDQELLEVFSQGLTLPEMAELMQRSSRSIELRIEKLLRKPSDADLFDDDLSDVNPESGLLDDSYDGGWEEMVQHGHKLAAYMLRNRPQPKPTTFD